MIAFVPLAAEPLFYLGSFPVTNSMVDAWLVAIFFIGIAFIASRRRSVVPHGIHTVFEIVVTGLLNEMEKVTENKEKARAFFPLVATVFLFILASNWLGLLPGTGTVGLYGLMHGEVELIPLLRPATSDLNLTLAMAALCVIISHVAGIRATGLYLYASKFVNLRGIILAVKKGPMAIIVAVIEFFVGLLEIVSEFARVLSLSLRLFGNVFAGEVLIGVMMGLISYVVPIPFLFLEILVGVIQATVFAMLVLVFLTVATTSHGHEEEAHQPAHA